jgi:hypothetical protein
MRAEHRPGRDDRERHGGAQEFLGPTRQREDLKEHHLVKAPKRDDEQ